MTTEAKIQLTSTELGSLWQSYMTLSLRTQVYGFLKAKTIDKEAQDILATLIPEAQDIINKIVTVFNNEKAVIPLGFDARDIVMEAPALYDDLFHIMFVRQMMKLNLGNFAVYSAMSYMKEINDIFKSDYDVSNKYYLITTKYLLEKGVLAKPPRVTMPKKVEFIQDKNHMSGLNIFNNKGPLSTIEVAYIYEAIEDNIFGIQLMTGFAQVARESEVKKYFIEGK